MAVTAKDRIAAMNVCPRCESRLRPFVNDCKIAAARADGPISLRRENKLHRFHYNHLINAGNVSAGVVPYSNIGQIEWTSPIGYGNCNGLEAGLSHRMTSGLSLRAAFTHSRSLDNVFEELETNSGDAPNHRD